MVFVKFFDSRGIFNIPTNRQVHKLENGLELGKSVRLVIEKAKVPRNNVLGVIRVIVPRARAWYNFNMPDETARFCFNGKLNEITYFKSGKT